MQMPRSGFWYGGIGVNSGSDGSAPLPSQLNPSYAREVPAQDAGRQEFYSTTNLDELDDGNKGDDGGLKESQYGGYGLGYGYNYGGQAAQREPVETQEHDSIAEAEALANHFTDVATEAVGNSEPVFSDVSDLEPVYSFSSRSKYNRGRAVFSQSRYTPGDPAALPPLPLSSFRRPAVQSRPADAPVKGGV